MLPLNLNIETLNTSFNTTYSPQSSSGPFKMEVPQSSVNVVKPISYQFRVAEQVDFSTGEVVKVGLQVQVWEHSHFGGTGVLRQDWMDVERVQVAHVS
jgi:hypothetical protein